MPGKLTSVALEPESTGLLSGLSGHGYPLLCVRSGLASFPPFCMRRRRRCTCDLLPMIDLEGLTGNAEAISHDLGLFHLNTQEDLPDFIRKVAFSPYFGAR
jgi:hypothetical protein